MLTVRSIHTGLEGYAAYPVLCHCAGLRHIVRSLLKLDPNCPESNQYDVGNGRGAAVVVRRRCCGVCGRCRWRGVLVRCTKEDSQDAPHARCHAPKTAPALARAQNSELGVDSKQTSL